MIDRYYQIFLTKLDYHFFDNLLKLLAVVVVSVMMSYLVKFLLRHISHFLLKRHKDPVWIDAISSPIIIFTFFFCLTMLFQYNREFSWMFSHSILITIQNIAMILCLGWFLTRYSDLLQVKYLESVDKRTFDKGAVDAIGKLSKIIIWIIICLLLMNILGFDIRGLVTFASVSAFAVAFASKELLSNFFGTIIIYLDKPFVVGDFINIPKGASGSVEYIGWRMTILRTLEKTHVYVPNSVFSSEVIENYTRRTHRMLKEVIGVRHKDINKLDDIIKDIRTFLGSHRNVSSDQPIIVGLGDFSDSSVNFIISACIESIDIASFYNIKTEIMLYVYEIIKKHCAEISYSTGTVPGEIVHKIINTEG